LTGGASLVAAVVVFVGALVVLPVLAATTGL